MEEFSSRIRRSKGTFGGKKAGKSGKWRNVTPLSAPGLPLRGMRVLMRAGTHAPRRHIENLEAGEEEYRWTREQQWYSETHRSWSVRG